MDPLVAKFEKYREAREAYEVAHAASAEAHKAWRAAERELVDLMLDQHVKKVTIGELTPLLVNAVSISVTQDNYDSIREWLVETVGDDKDFVVTVPHKPTVLQHVKKLVEEGEEIPAFLQCDTRPTLRVDGWRSRS